jgi:hypothetical protein
MKKHFLILCLLFSPAVVLASTSDGLVTAPLVTQWGFAMFGVATTGTFGGTKPACATVPAWNQWVVDLSTPAGRAMYGTVLQAYALGKTLHVHGRDNCGLWADREGVDHLYISN